MSPQIGGDTYLRILCTPQRRHTKWKVPEALTLKYFYNNALQYAILFTFWENMKCILKTNFVWIFSCYFGIDDCLVLILRFYSTIWTCLRPKTLYDYRSTTINIHNTNTIWYIYVCINIAYYPDQLLAVKHYSMSYKNREITSNTEILKHVTNLLFVG